MNTEWQPIDTAPKEDGVPILGWNGQACIFEWSSRYEMWLPAPEDDPTHWIPIPAPPKQS